MESDAQQLPLIYTGDYLNPTRESAAPPSGEFAAHRRAARAVIINDSGAVHIMHAAKRGFYKLPGGGVDPDESIGDALTRELIEETGYRVEVLKPIGRTVQYDHSGDGFIQDSYAYLVKIRSAGPPQLTAKEAEAGFVVVKFPDIGSAVRAMLSYKAPEGHQHPNQSMFYRDAAILEAGHLLITLP